MCTRCSYPAYTCKNCPVVVNYWEALPFAWKEISEGIKDVHMTLQDLCVIYNSASKSKNWKPEDFTPKIKTTELSFSRALEIIRINPKKGMRLPFWKSDVKIRVQYPDSNSKMTAPYLYAESFRDGKIRRVPWRETFPELFSEEWEIVSDDSNEEYTKRWCNQFKDAVSKMNTTTSTSKGYPNGATTTYTSR